MTSARQRGWRRPPRLCGGHRRLSRTAGATLCGRCRTTASDRLYPSTTTRSFGTRKPADRATELHVARRVFVPGVCARRTDERRQRRHTERHRQNRSAAFGIPRQCVEPAEPTLTTQATARSGSAPADSSRGYSCRRRPAGDTRRTLRRRASRTSAARARRTRARHGPGGANRTEDVLEETRSHHADE